MASFTQPEDDSVPTTGSTRPFDDDGYVGYDPRLSSQPFDSFVDSESLKDSATDSPIFHGSAVDDAFATQPASEAFSPPSIYAESNGQGFDGGFGGSDDPHVNKRDTKFLDESLVASCIFILCFSYSSEHASPISRTGSTFSSTVARRAGSRIYIVLLWRLKLSLNISLLQVIPCHWQKWREPFQELRIPSVSLAISDLKASKDNLSTSVPTRREEEKAKLKRKSS